MNLSLNLPTPWTQTLTHIHKKWPSAIIAGGALRDLDNERPVKDIDIFVPAPVTLQEVQRLFPDASERTIEEMVIGSTPSDGTELQSQYQFSVQGWNFELIPKLFPIDVCNLIERFDIKLCRIAFDGYHVWASSDYLDDCRNKTITILRSANISGHGELAHAHRIHEKYPEFTIVDARENIDL